MNTRCLTLAKGLRESPKHAPPTRPRQRSRYASSETQTKEHNGLSAAWCPMRTSHHHQGVDSSRLVEYVRPPRSHTRRLGQHMTPANWPSVYSFPETYPKQVTIGVIYVVLCTHEAFLTAVPFYDFTRTSFMSTPLIVSNPGAEFRKTR